jgi:hypothetical protein
MKTKKYFLYIFLLIIFFGSYATDANAQSGYCSIAPYNTRSGCVNGGGTWTPTVSSTGIPTYGSLNTPPDPCAAITGISKVICQLHKILNLAIPFIITLGLIYFIWGVVQYMIGGGDEAKKKGRDHIIYGLIGLAVIVGVWGLVNIVVDTFGLTGQLDLTPKAPQKQDGSCSNLTTLPNKAKFQDLLCYITNIINSAIIPLIFSLAFLSFIWGIVQFVINSDDEAKKTKGKQFMLWGIIALTVMVSVWGLVNILGATFNVNGSFLPQVKSKP